MNVKTLKKIKRYGKLRFKGNEKYNEDIFVNIYKNANKDLQEQYDKEIDKYLDAIKNKRLEPGQSVLKLFLTDDIQ